MPSAFFPALGWFGFGRFGFGWFFLGLTLFDLNLMGFVFVFSNMCYVVLTLVQLYIFNLFLSSFFIVKGKAFLKSKKGLCQKIYGNRYNKGGFD